MQEADFGRNLVEFFIPYRNPLAVLAYYCGVFSLIPVAGFGFAVPALVLGIMGWRRCRRDREVRGGVHAWIGIVLGALTTMLWAATIALFVFALVLARGTS